MRRTQVEHVLSGGAARDLPPVTQATRISDTVSRCSNMLQQDSASGPAVRLHRFCCRRPAAGGAVLHRRLW